MNEYKMSPERQELCNEIRKSLNRSDVSIVEAMCQMIEDKVENERVWHSRLYWATIAAIGILTIIFK